MRKHIRRSLWKRVFFYSSLHSNHAQTVFDKREDGCDVQGEREEKRWEMRKKAWRGRGTRDRERKEEKKRIVVAS